MDCIERKDLGAFEYTRVEFASALLGSKQTLGLVRPRGVSRPRTTVYYFHAGNADDRMLVDLELPARSDDETVELLISAGVQLALPNFGLNFLLSAQEDPKRPFQEYFFNEVMPLAEAGTDTTASTRFLSGASLGGHSVLVAFLRRPELFQGVASTAGALLNFDFYSTEQFDRYVRAGAVSSEVAASLKQIFLGCFESYALYRKIDPLLMLPGLGARALAEKRVLLEVGSADDFGFQLGMSELSEALSATGVQHRFDVVEGGRHAPAFLISRFGSMLRYLLTPGGAAT